jgi:hypothetical protein
MMLKPYLNLALARFELDITQAWTVPMLPTQLLE